MVDSTQTHEFTSADRIRQLNDIDQVYSSFPELEIGILTRRIQGCRKIDTLCWAWNPSPNECKARLVFTDPQRLSRITQDPVQRSHRTVLRPPILH